MYFFFLGGGVESFLNIDKVALLGGRFLRYLSNFSPPKLGKMNPFDFFGKMGGSTTT